MRYVRCDEREGQGLRPEEEIKFLYIEINDEGIVVREIGVDQNGNVVHKAPTWKSQYGLFDCQRVVIFGLADEIDTAEVDIRDIILRRDADDLDSAEFDKLWNSSSWGD